MRAIKALLCAQVCADIRIQFGFCFSLSLSVSHSSVFRFCFVLFYSLSLALFSRSSGAGALVNYVTRSSVLLRTLAARFGRKTHLYPVCAPRASFSSISYSFATSTQLRVLTCGFNLDKVEM